VPVLTMPVSGNTPTGVGKTANLDGIRPHIWKHPHGRGEDQAMAENASGQGGNTPTGVGKTHRCSVSTMSLRKHPHGRGEDNFMAYIAAQKQETPPRAWGRLAY